MDTKAPQLGSKWSLARSTCLLRAYTRTRTRAHTHTHTHAHAHTHSLSERERERERDPMPNTLAAPTQAHSRLNIPVVVFTQIANRKLVVE